MPRTPKPPVVLRERKSRFVEIFRTNPPRTVCPNFYVLAHANGCGFSPWCSYCYLKSSFWHQSGTHVFTNVKRIEREIRGWLARDDHESFVLNSGNLSDSLSLEQARPLIGRLIEMFRGEAEAVGRPHCLLLVTKGGREHCEPLLERPPCRNVIVSFSVNCPEVARVHESGAAPAEGRLAAAAELMAAGWRVRIRIDPMILGHDYRPLARQVRDMKPERVTLGSLRAEPGLLRIHQNGLFSALEQPDEAKQLARYPLGPRLALYRQAADILKKTCPVALCEETRDVWEALDLNPDGCHCNCGL